MHYLLIHQYQFTQHLKLFRQFYLLQNGEFYHAFLEATEAYKMQASPAAQHGMRSF